MAQPPKSCLDYLIFWSF